MVNAHVPDLRVTGESDLGSIILQYSLNFGKPDPNTITKPADLSRPTAPENVRQSVMIKDISESLVS